MTSIQKQNRKKGGRPPTGRVRKLSKSVTVKFSKPSYEALRLRARKANRMANNLNQLTKLSHQRGFQETHVYVVDLLKRLKTVLVEYRQGNSKPNPSGMNRREDTP